MIIYRQAAQRTALSLRKTSKYSRTPGGLYCPTHFRCAKDRHCLSLAPLKCLVLCCSVVGNHRETLNKTDGRGITPLEHNPAVAAYSRLIRKKTNRKKGKFETYDCLYVPPQRDNGTIIAPSHTSQPSGALKSSVLVPQVITKKPMTSCPSTKQYKALRPSSEPNAVLATVAAVATSI